MATQRNSWSQHNHHSFTRYPTSWVHSLSTVAGYKVKRACFRPTVRFEAFYQNDSIQLFIVSLGSLWNTLHAGIVTAPRFCSNFGYNSNYSSQHGKWVFRDPKYVNSGWGSNGVPISWLPNVERCVHRIISRGHEQSQALWDLPPIYHYSSFIIHHSNVRISRESADHIELCCRWPSLPATEELCDVLFPRHSTHCAGGIWAPRCSHWYWTSTRARRLHHS